MKILLAGASGFIGGALVPALRAEGHEIRRLVRRSPSGPDEIAWHPGEGRLDPAALEGIDAVVNLAGENVGAGRWTVKRREAILRSRTDSTRTLVTTLAKLKRKPAVLLSASACGFYGERGDEVLTEASAIGHGFLPEVCLAWETHAEGAARSGVRTVLLRFGVVLAPDGGALAKMLPLFRRGLGGRLGRGAQWMSWIGIDDAVDAIRHALREPRLTGPVNIVAPAPVRNVEFTATLLRVLRRPALLPVPATVLKWVFGQMAEETLLASTRTVPQRLQDTGFVFRHPTLEEALRATV